MQKGWKATGLLKPLWGKAGGRDGLARKAGMQPATISGYNTGRLNMTLQAARRIALALDVTIYDLGAPVDAETSSSPLLAELAEIRATLEAMVRREDATEERIAAQLKAQSDLLATLTAVAAELRKRVGLGEASEAAPPRSPRRRPA